MNPLSAELMRAILDGYPLPREGTHGIGHWGRVLRNGLRLAEHTGADTTIVHLFAVLHDCRRQNEGFDPGHGLRGAEFARTLLGRSLHLEPERFERLHYACTHHTDGLIEADPTIQTCWDADRLDLGRVWITPRPVLLCTAASKDPAMIEWADERARRGHVPRVVDGWLAEIE